MSTGNENKSPLDIAAQAERDLNSHSAKHGASAGSDSIFQPETDIPKAADSGINEAAVNKFPGASVTIGSAASGAGDNREIPVSEGGDIGANGKPTKARDFEGTGGPEDKARQYAQDNGGNDDVRSNVRQGGETVRPPGSASNDAAGGQGKSTV